MDIEKAKEYLYDLEYGLKLEQEENIKKCGYNPEQEIEAIETVLNELDKKDKDIAELKQDIKEIMGKDRDCLTFGYHSAYVGLIDDLINIIEEN